jgi:hypothetical protein
MKQSDSGLVSLSRLLQRLRIPISIYNSRQPTQFFNFLHSLVINLKRTGTYLEIPIWHTMSNFLSFFGCNR